MADTIIIEVSRFHPEHDAEPTYQAGWAFAEAAA